MSEKDVLKGRGFPRKIYLRIMLPALFAVCLLFSAVSAAGHSDSRTGRIEGTVSGPKGNPVAGVKVTAMSPNLIRPQSANSDADGHYSITNLPPGTYTVMVEATGEFERFERADVEVHLSQITSVGIALKPKERESRMTRKPAGTHFPPLLVLAFNEAGNTLGQSDSGTVGIKGTVSDPKGHPVADVTVTATSPDAVRPLSAKSDADGHYRITNLPPGTYTVTVEATGEFARFERAGVKVQLTGPSILEIVLAPKECESRITRKPAWIHFSRMLMLFLNEEGART